MLDCLTFFSILVMSQKSGPRVSLFQFLRKKGSRENPDNYRGITILSCMGKLFTSFLNTRISVFFNLTVSYFVLL